jgi:hypothetical protein
MLKILYSLIKSYLNIMLFVLYYSFGVELGLIHVNSLFSDFRQYTFNHGTVLIIGYCSISPAVKPVIEYYIDEVPEWNFIILFILLLHVYFIIIQPPI